MAAAAAYFGDSSLSFASEGHVACAFAAAKKSELSPN